MTETSYHMSAEEFRKQATQIIDWIVDYHERRVTNLPVLSRVDPGTIRRELPEHGGFLTRPGDRRWGRRRW